MSCAQQEATKLQLLKAADAEGEGCGLLQEGPERESTARDMA